jgi:cell division transport system permease protein
MILLSFARALKFGLQDVIRNVWLSITTIIILILALFSINMLITVDVISDAAIDAVKEKIDISLYIKNSADEASIAALRSKIAAMSQVKEVQYISKAQALEDFKVRHKDSPDVLESLRELGRNPLSPTMIIKPRDIDQYEDLIDRLNRLEDNIIESRNFDNHKTMLSKVNVITHKVSQVGLMVSMIFIFVTVMVVFNAVRVAIYTHRREIKIMRLVGASKWFIRMPYVFSSVFYTLIGVLVIMALYYPFLSILQPYLEAFFVDYNINLITYYNENFIRIFGMQFLVGSAINMLASLVAIRRYSQV